MRVALSVALAATATALGACSATSPDSGGGPPEPSEQGITLYSGRIPSAIGGAIDMYEAKADRDVQVRFGDTGDLAATSSIASRRSTATRRAAGSGSPAAHGASPTAPT
jgi:hypothetical protein